ncbi:periplasmic heavy metal sensor [Octadecabacter sp. G9-8]|uniref:Periplasmic heavy metal sensor n=1 Tax=Octadecabacter dasysiphoniae TaxID=2909341 RepID=A0ABS9CSP3_9RHOB|nr:periplasmic heavy metal sensor [Octadecabacter dasysiphoniae]MCF2869966.1 periplasmic heavy metal sensor [Octadecabacter dasysiphoniae]
MSEENTKKRRWQRILLVGSLALNLAVVGVVAGVAFGGGPKERMQRFDLTVGPLTRAMDNDRREAVRDALRNSGAFRPADRNGIRSDMAAMLNTLRQDQFDEEAFRSALLRQRERLQSGQVAVVDAVTVQITDMSAQERAEFADRLEEQLRRGAPQRADRSGG